MLSLRKPRHYTARSRSDVFFALLAAASATSASFVAVILSLYRVTPERGVAPRQHAPASELVVIVEPRAPSTVNHTPVFHRSPVTPAPRASRSVAAPHLDTGSAEGRSAAIAADAVRPSPPSALSIDATSRLARPHPDHVGRWVVPRIARDPFAEPAPLDPVERDSVLSALSTMTPEAAAHRTPTRAEVDSAAKEATRKMRLAGRPLLVPPDNSGGLVTLRLPLPGEPSKAERTRVRSADDEGQARLRRLRARADSARRVAHDSIVVVP